MLANGPLQINIDAKDMDDYGPTGDDPAPVFRCGLGAAPGHAVTLVGYTSTYWIIKNSWGDDWGLNGYIHITRSRTNKRNCQIQHDVLAYVDECNISNCVQC